MKKTILILALCACTTTTGSNLPPTPPRLPATTVKYERMVLFAVSEGRARLRGFSGAAPEGYVIDVVRDGMVTGSITADAAGRFDLEFGADANAEVELRPHSGVENAEPLKFKVRDRAQAVTDVVRGKLAGTGSTPNQIVLDREGSTTGNTRLIVVLSGDNAVQPIDMDLGLPQGEFTAFPDVATATGVATPSPWNAVTRGDIVYVTRYGQGGVSGVEITRGAVHGQVDPMMTVRLDEAITLDPPADADGNGTNETRAEYLVPRSPTGIDLAGQKVVAAYANVLTQDSNGRAQYGPGMLAAFPLRDDGRLDGNVTFVQTRFKNPQHVVVMPGGRELLVSSPGPLQRVNGAWQIEGEGGIEIFDAQTLESLHSFNLGTFAPGRPTVLGDGKSIYVPSILRARMLRIDVEARTLVKGPGDAIVLENTDELRTTFECVMHASELVFCGTFDTDSLTVIDSLDDTVRPWPFTGDILLRASGTSARIGVHSLAIRPGRNGVDRTGNDIAILNSLASTVVTLDTRFVFGP